MSDVEGVTAEETTAPESVENETPTPETEEVAEQGETEVTEDAEDTQQQESELSDEELDKLLDNPKAKERLEKRIQEEVDRKTARQKAANRQLQRKVEELQKMREQKPLEKPKLEDFDTDEAYNEAVEKYDNERVERLANEKALEKEADEAARVQVEQARETFQAKEAEVIAENPDYQENTAVVREYIDMVTETYPDDPGFKEFGNYIAFECDNAPALLNHLGKNPEKIEVLLGKPPQLIKRKLQGYMKEISAPKPPAKAPLPKPPSSTKGSATPKPSPEKLGDPDEFMRWRNKQLKRK